MLLAAYALMARYGRCRHYCRLRAFHAAPLLLLRRLIFVTPLDRYASAICH